MKKIIVILLLISAFYSCERDDICAESTPTTPHLVIRFYNIDEQSETKKVVGLRIEGIDDIELGEFQAVAETDSIAIPLRTIDDDDDPLNGVTTRFKLHKEYEEDADGNVTGGNEDIISITYNPVEIYVSRACGYKTIFEELEITLEQDLDNWIELIPDNTLTVDNETAAHIQIYH